MDPWNDIKADREAFADYLDTLSPEQWDERSLCADWTVKDVTAHLLVAPTMSKGQVFVAFLKAGFNLDKMSATLVDRMTATMTTEELVATTRATAGVRSAPPGLKPLGVFGEVLTHTTDVSLATGAPFELPVDHYVIGLDYFKDVKPVLGCRQRVAGLTLRTTDAEWTSGDGPLVEGPARLLLSAVTGRPAAFAGLTGDGVATMRAR